MAHKKRKTITLRPSKDLMARIRTIGAEFGYTNPEQAFIGMAETWMAMVPSAKVLDESGSQRKVVELVHGSNGTSVRVALSRVA